MVACALVLGVAGSGARRIVEDLARPPAPPVSVSAVEPPSEETPDRYAPENEIVSMRDAYTRTYRNADGSVTAVISARPEFYEDGRGNWEPIDLALVREPRDGSNRTRLAEGQAEPRAASDDDSYVNRTNVLET
jgi:hypothetical protein